MSGDKPETLGSIAMLIRTAAGWSRVRFAESIGISEADLKAFEYNKNPLSLEQRQRLIRSQVMRDGGLVDLAHAAGIVPASPDPGLARDPKDEGSEES